MSSLKTLENTIRKIVREEIERAIPTITEQLVESFSYNPRPMTNDTTRPMVPGETRFAGTKEDIRNMLKQKVNFSMDGPDWMTPEEAAYYGTNPQSQTPRSPAQGRSTLLPEQLPGESGARPVGPLGSQHEPVLKAMNRDYSDLVKAWGIK